MNRPYQIILISFLCFVQLFISGVAQAKTNDSWFGRDKARHFFVSALTTGGLSWNQKHRFHRNQETDVRVGAGITFSMGLAKEMRDARKPGGFFNWKDLAADATGIAAGILLLGRW